MFISENPDGKPHERSDGLKLNDAEGSKQECVINLRGTCERDSFRAQEMEPKGHREAVTQIPLPLSIKRMT